MSTAVNSGNTIKLLDKMEKQQIEMEQSLINMIDKLEDKMCSH